MLQLASPSPIVLCTLLSLGALSLGAAPSTAPQDPVAAVQAEGAEHLTEWPEGPSKKALTKSIGKLRKAASEEMVERGHAELVAAGAGAVPGLLKALGKERDDDAAGRMREALDALTKPEHTRLLSSEFDSKRAPVQLYTMRRVSELGDAGLREACEARLAELAEMKADPKRKKNVSEALERHVAVLTLSTGSAASLRAVEELAGSGSYKAWRSTVEAAARHARAAGSDVADGLTARLRETKDSKSRVACLRLLTWAGTKDHAGVVAPSLDAKDINEKKAAINALRRMVDGAEPIQKLSSFDAIGRADEWKKRL